MDYTQIKEGYVFEARKDNLDNVGVIESFTNTVNDEKNTYVIGLTVCTDIDGNPLIPAYNDYNNGYIALNRMLHEAEESREETILRFCKSRKSIVGVMGIFAFVVSGNLIIDKDTKEIKMNKINFFLPKGMIDEQSDEPKLVTDIVADVNGINTCKINKGLLDAKMQTFMNFLLADDTHLKDRYSYILSRLKNC